jgi:hypothetical protein
MEVFSLEKPRIALAYNSDENDDGTGAQIQRIMGIYAVCKKFGFNYVHMPIKNLLVFPLDSLDSPIEVEKYLHRVNDYFKLPSDDINQYENVLDGSTITLRKLRKMKFFRQFSKTKKILIRVSNVNSIVDKNPNIFSLAVSDLIQSTDQPPKEKLSIILHIRGTVQDDLIIKGEVETRSLPISYYKNKLREILALVNPALDYEVKVFTDIPKENLSFVPRPEDIKAWEKSGHRIEDGRIRVDGLNLEREFREFGSSIEFVYGGDPLDALIEMSRADYFVMSRSSFSYLAGVLNLNGAVFHPPKFWHTPLSNWIAG